MMNLKYLPVIALKLCFRNSCFCYVQLEEIFKLRPTFDNRQRPSDHNLKVHKIRTHKFSNHLLFVAHDSNRSKYLVFLVKSIITADLIRILKDIHKHINNVVYQSHTDLILIQRNEICEIELKQVIYSVLINHICIIATEFKVTPNCFIVFLLFGIKSSASNHLRLDFLVIFIGIDRFWVVCHIKYYKSKNFPI